MLREEWFMRENGGMGRRMEKADKENIVGTVLYLNIDGNVVGKIVLTDEIKPSTKATMEKLHKLGIKTKMFSVD